MTPSSRPLAALRRWAARLAALGVVVVAAALVWHGAALTPTQRGAAWLGLLAVVLLLLRLRGVGVVGPVFWYDLVRSGRRGRTFAVRTGYLGALFAALLLTYATWSSRLAFSPALRPADAARFALSFFYGFSLAQFLLAVVLTPAFVAGAVAEEKEKRTLPFLLATDLRAHEIILGKLASRLGHLLLLLLSGLPLLALLQLLGGVDPLLAGASCLATGLAVLGLAGLSLFLSCLCGKSRHALLGAYLLAVAYAVAAPSLYAAARRYDWDDYVSTSAWEAPASDLTEAFAGGHPFFALRRLALGGPLHESLPIALGDWARFYLVVAAVGLVGAALTLRPRGLRDPQTPGAAAPAAAPPRPRVGDAPMLWKEAYVEGGRGWGRVVLLGVALGGSFALLAADLRPVRWIGWARYLQGWAQMLGTLGACALLIGVLVRAAGSVAGERERATLDGLLATPLSAGEVLGAKWLGAVCGVRLLALWPGVVYLAAALGGGLSPLALPLLAVLWFAFAAGLASLGLLCSVVCRTTARATAAALALGLAVSFGHWLLWLPLSVLAGPRRAPDDGLAVLARLQGALTPPAALAAYASFRTEELSGPGGARQREGVAFALVAAAFWGVFALALWRRALARFERETGRRDEGARDAHPRSAPGSYDSTRGYPPTPIKG
jgi:ABC-type transport system involved in multi-copper enzyme maturation permease subunit